MDTWNPVLRNVDLVTVTDSPGEARAMTLDGTIHRAGFLLLLVIAGALWPWTHDIGVNPHNLRTAIAALICSLAAFVLVWLTVHHKRWSVFTGPVYALLEGFVIGSVSARLETRHPGIGIEAVGLTFAVCFCLLLAYRAGLIHITDQFNRGLAAAIGGVATFYLATFILRILGIRSISMLEGGIPGILTNTIVVMIAGLSMVADVDFISKCAHTRLPKYMEWYTALGFTMTLIWLYVEILRLLSKSRTREESA